MKRKILFTLMVVFITTAQLFAAIGDYTGSFTIMIGDSVNFNPHEDCGFHTVSQTNLTLYGCTYQMTYNDISGLTVSPTKLSTGYYRYGLTALKRGTYQMTVSISYGFGSSGPFTRNATYNIKVIDVTQINMPSVLNLQPGQTYTLTPQLLETGATSELTWTSSNTGVAVVNSEGKIRCLRPGTTNITCTAYNGVSATCKLTVVPVIAESFTLEETTLELEPNETAQLTPIFTPENTTDQSLNYKSSNINVATVDEYGMVTGVNMGTCAITATTQDGSSLKSTCTVTVKPIVTSINLGGTMELTLGESTQLLPVITQEGAETTLSWSSSNTSVVTVDNAGNLDAHRAGTATITCTAANGVAGTLELTVQPQKNHLSIDDCSGVIGSPFTLPVVMANEKKISAFQFEVEVPAGVALTACNLTSRSGTDHSTTFTLLSNGNYQVVAFSPSSEVFSGINGAVADLTFNSDNTMSGGNYEIVLKNIELTTQTGLGINPVNSTAVLTLGNVQLADTNGDGNVTITDAVAIVNYILGNPPAGFKSEAADVNGDGKISITDAVAIVNMILNGQTSAKHGS